MVSELDRWRTAQQLIKAHGSQAEYEAGRRAGDFLTQGNRDGFYLWQDIALKIGQLQKNPSVGQQH